MKRAVINPEVCKNCDPCLVDLKCVNNAIIREESSDKPWIDFYKCSGCMKCKTYCFNDAINEISHPCDGTAKMGW